MDPTKRHTDHITETQQSHHLKDVSKMLSAPLEKVRVWLEDEGIGSVSGEEPEVYRSEVLEVLRGRDQIENALDLRGGANSPSPDRPPDR